MRTITISNSDDVIDSRDVIARIDQLESGIESEFDDWFASYQQECRDEEGAAVPEDDDKADYRARFDKEHEDEPDQQELKALRELAEEGASSPDWSHGETLIRDGYFVDYAQQLAEDIGAIDHNAKWPLNHIDWDAAVDALQSDYTSVDFDGETYWIRA